MAAKIKRIIEEDGSIHYYLGDLHHNPEGHIRSFLTGGRNIKRDISFQVDVQIITINDTAIPLVPILHVWA